MACWAYEGLLMFGVVFLAGYLFGTLSQTRNGLDNRNALQAFLFVIFGIIVIFNIFGILFNMYILPQSPKLQGKYQPKYCQADLEIWQYL